MDDFKKYANFRKPFIDISTASSAKIRYISQPTTVTLSAEKQPIPMMCASLSYLYDNFRLKGKFLSGEQYLYKILYNPKSLPLFFRGSFQVGNNRSENLIENKIELEYKHNSANFYIKLRNTPRNAVMRNTIGSKTLGIHTKLKTNLRFDEIINFSTGIYYLQDDLKFMIKYKYFDSLLDVWYEQAILKYTSFIQSLSLQSFNTLKSLQIGVLHRYSDNISFKLKATDKGNLILGYCMNSRQINFCLSLGTNTNKIMKNQVECSLGVQIEINI